MAFSIKFNEIELSDIVDGFTSIQRDTGGGFTTNLQSSNGAPQTTRYGQEFLFNTVNTKTITVTYVLHGNLSDWTLKRNQIASILNVTEPAPLIFGDEPNKVWYAVADGNQTLTEDLTTRTATGVLIFLVPSGISESTYTQTLNSENSGEGNGTITKNSDGSYSALINNQGSLETFPSIKIKFPSDDGYVGIVGQNGLMEIGNKEEADTQSYLYNQSMLNDSASALFSKLTQASITQSPVNNGVTLNGTLRDGGDGIRLGSYGTGSGYHGGALKFDVPTDLSGHKGAKNWYSWFNIWFWAGAFGQTGIIQLWFMDKNDVPIVMNEVVKSDLSGNTAYWKGWVADGKGGIRLITQASFQSNNAESNQSSPNAMYWQGGGAQDLLKNGANIGFYWYGRQNFYVPEIENMEVDHIYVDLGAYSNKSMVSNISLRKLTFEEQNETLYKDVPNKFSADSELVIDMDNGKIIKDSLPTNNLFVLGSKFFSLPPGQSELKIIPSSWFTGDLEIEVTWIERNL